MKATAVCRGLHPRISFTRKASWPRTPRPCCQATAARQRCPCPATAPPDLPARPHRSQSCCTRSKNCKQVQGAMLATQPRRRAKISALQAGTPANDCVAEYRLGGCRTSPRLTIRPNPLARSTGPLCLPSLASRRPIATTLQDPRSGGSLAPNTPTRASPLELLAMNPHGVCPTTSTLRLLQPLPVLGNDALAQADRQPLFDAHQNLMSNTHVPKQQGFAQGT